MRFLASFSFLTTRGYACGVVAVVLAAGVAAPAPVHAGGFSEITGFFTALFGSVAPAEETAPRDDARARAFAPAPVLSSPPEEPHAGGAFGAARTRVSPPANASLAATAERRQARERYLEWWNGLSAEERRAIIDVQRGVAPVESPPEPQIVLFNADSIKVPPGTPVTLSWQAEDATACRIIQSAPGSFTQDQLPLSGSVTVPGSAMNQIGKNAFTLLCEQARGLDAIDQTSVTVTFIANFAAAPQPIAVGETLNFSWTTNGAAKCDLWRGVPGVTSLALLGSNLPPNDGYSFSYTSGETRFTLICSSAAGVSSQETIRVTESSGGTVICTELNRQGLLSDEMYAVEAEYGRTRVSAATMYGYQLWARPLVRIMRKSEAFTKAVHFVARPWIEQMAYEMGAREEGSLVGSAMMAVGKPLSKAVGMTALALEDIRGRETRLAQE